MSRSPLVLWFRRDLRLQDNPMLAEALRSGRPVIPVFILDPETEALGAAAKWRLGLSVEAFARSLEAVGSRLTLRRGGALEVLQALTAETGASGVRWSRLLDPASRARDSAVKSALRLQGVTAESHPGQVLFEPWQVSTGQGGFYKVFSPFWRAVRSRDVGPPEAGVTRLAAPDLWPLSDRIADWRMGAAMDRGAGVVARFQAVGEGAALERLQHFLAGPVAQYGAARDQLALSGTSLLSENLTYGEIGPRQVWHAVMQKMHEGDPGAEAFLRQIVWREFAWYLFYHSPRLDRENWKEGWDDFPWRRDNEDAERWRRGMTGEPMVDAAMREMYVTGRMHNRARMITASYLTKHLMTDWRVGLSWFAECLTDWDAAANAMGWQWVAGSGPDAAPYFRVFNPAGQADRFDAESAYRHRFVAELSRTPGPEALAYFDAVPRSWRLERKAPYPEAMIELAAGRARALEAYGARNA